MEIILLEPVKWKSDEENVTAWSNKKAKKISVSTYNQSVVFFNTF